MRRSVLGLNTVFSLYVLSMYKYNIDDIQFYLYLFPQITVENTMEVQTILYLNHDFNFNYLCPMV